MRLDPLIVREHLARFLAEDVGRGDITTSLVVPDTSGRARVEAREDCVVAGLEVAQACFELVAGEPISWEPNLADGDRTSAGATIVKLEARLAAILTGERTALNLLQRMSGVATATRSYVEAIAGTSARIVDTRKTVPGLRLFDKYAVRCGGGSNHRFGLDDGILIKDNHIASVGGDVAEAVHRARARAPHGLKIEIEVTELDGLQEAISAGADLVLLDNFSPEAIRDAVAAAGGKVLLEASGGIVLDNVRTYAEAGVDLISIGALTHSAPAIDLALEVEG